MDRNAIVHHLRAWADGIDPDTGAMLPPDHPGQRADALRVIFATLALLEGQPTAYPPLPTERAGAASSSPRNAGRSWSATDDDALVQAFDAGSTISSIAEGLGRTRGAITARLVKLGKIEAPPGLRLRGDPGPHTGSASASN